MQRSPTKPYSSNPDVSTAGASNIATKVTQRKRKQPECELLEAFNAFQLKITESINDFRLDLNSKIDKLDDSIKHVKSDIEQFRSELKNEIAVLRSEQTSVKQQVDGLALEVAALQQTSVFVTNKHEELQKCIDGIKCRTEKFNTENSTFSLEVKIDALEQQARQCNLEISNFPERRGENLIEIVESVGNLTGCVVSRRDIISVHRVPHAQHNTRPKNIIVKFTTRILRDNLLSAFRLKKGLTAAQLGITGSNNIIYLNEHLTLRNKHLFRAAREAAKREKFKYAWIKHGTILVRESDNSPVAAIRSERDIQKIKSRQSVGSDGAGRDSCNL